MRRSVLSIMTVAAMLTGCAAKPVELGLARPVAMPSLPSSLSQRAKPLPVITDPSMKGIVASAAEATRGYNDVGHRLNALIDGWDCVRKALNDGADAGKCLN